MEPIPLPDAATQEVIVDYDPDEYPWRELVCEILQEDNLESLHLTPNGIEATDRNTPVKSSRNVFNRRWRSATCAGGSHVEKVRALTAKFCAEVCGPAIGMDCDVVVHQTLPTFRAHLAGTGKALGPRHRDCEYKHQPSEVNFWIPLVPVFGSNSLHSESTPGQQDFHPFVANNGQAVRFWGNQCEHFTIANDTDVTRISLDIRVIPAPCYIPKYLFIPPEVLASQKAKIKKIPVPSQREIIEDQENSSSTADNEPEQLEYEKDVKPKPDCRFMIGGWYRAAQLPGTDDSELTSWLDVWSQS